jgi:hypothetical protein
MTLLETLSLQDYFSAVTARLHKVSCIILGSKTSDPVPVAARSRRSSAAAPLLRSWVRIPPRAWMFVCGECYVLSGRGLCDEPITRPEESYRLWGVVVCDQETSKMRSWPALGRSATENKTNKTNKQNKQTKPQTVYFYCEVKGGGK